MPRPSRIGIVNAAFKSRVLPELASWGLSQHPNPTAYFGRDEHGYRYDLADVSDPSNARLATFAILGRDTTFWIKGHKGRSVPSDVRDLYILFHTVEGIYTFLPRFSLRRLFDPGFRLRPKQGESLDAAAERLMDEIESRLPLLKRYLYG
jgi:hypothetical protein